MIFHLFNQFLEKCSTLFLVVGIPLMTEPSLAFDFKFSTKEVVVVNDDFSDDSGNWLLNGTSINSGFLFNNGTRSFATASYSFNSALNLNDGAINLYWNVLFPTINVNRETDAYIMGLQYEKNPVFCWNPKNNNEVVLATNNDCSSEFTKVEEDAELRVWHRPTASGQSLPIRSYIDPDFTPGVEPENRTDFPSLLLDNIGNSETDYRLRIEKKNQRIESQLSFFDDAQNRWVVLGEPLVATPSQFQYVVAQNFEGNYEYGIDAPITFESLNILLRNDRNNSQNPTQIHTIAVTQEKITGTAVPEPLTILGAGTAIIFGTGFKRNLGKAKNR